MDLLGFIATILVALIGGPLLVLVKRMDRRNSSQHDTAQEERAEARREMNSRFDRLELMVDAQATAMSDHLTYHIKEKL